MNKVTPITSIASHHNTLSNNDTVLNLEAVLQQLEDWRTTKDQHQQISIPDSLWHNIFALTKTHSPVKLRGLFGISTAQYKKKYEQLYSNQNNYGLKNKNPSAAMNFYEVPPPRKNNKPMDLEPYVPVTTTLIVEFSRADGKIMKIHTTTDNFKNLIDAFYAGTN